MNPRTSFLLLRRRCSTSVEGGESSLISWVKEQGGRVRALRQQGNSREGHGLTTTDAVRAGDTIIALPSHLPLSAHTEHPVLLALFDRIPEELWTIKLGLKLLAERTRLPTSPWRPYIQNLPKRFTVPIFFNAEEIQALQYLPFTHQVEKRIKFLNEFASEAMPAIIGEASELEHPFHSHRILPHALAWSMAAVSSRAFRVHTSSGEGSSLLPLVDMCNHSFAPTGRLVQYTSAPQSSPFLEVVAAKDLEKGEDIVLNYGPRSNDVLLMDFGFMMPNNPNDRLELRYDGHLLDTACLVARVDSSCSFEHPAPWQQELLARLKLHGRDSSQLVVSMGGPELVDGRLLAAVRLMHAPASTDSVDLEALKGWASVPPLGGSNERKAVRTLIGLGMIALTSFPTGIEEDERELSKAGVSENLRLAIQFRMLKKQLLLETIEGLKARYTTP